MSRTATVCSFLLIVVGMAFGLDLLAVVWLFLGWIDIDRFTAAIEDGLVLLIAGVVAAGVAMLWSRLVWWRRNKRMRRYLMYVTRTSHTGTSSLGGDPSLSAAGGRTGPVDAARATTTALPDSSTISDLDSYRGRR